MGDHPHPHGASRPPSLELVRLAPVQMALYEETFVAPVRRLNETLTDVLDVDSHPNRDPEEALATLKVAIDEFHQDTADWL